MRNSSNLSKLKSIDGGKEGICRCTLAIHYPEDGNGTNSIDTAHVSIVVLDSLIAENIFTIRANRESCENIFLVFYGRFAQPECESFER